MAATDVWFDKLDYDSSRIIGTTAVWDEPGWKAIAEGRQPDIEALPLRIYAVYKDQDYTKLPPFFIGGGGYNVSSALANVLRQFDLGEESGLFPLQIYQYDRVTPVKTDHLLLRARAFKNGLVPTESIGLRTGKFSSQPPKRWFPRSSEDGDVAVGEQVLSGADLWFDEKLDGAMFMSDRLVQALRKAGFGRSFNLFRCRVIAMN
jgi:hypothetical protein